MALHRGGKKEEALRRMKKRKLLSRSLDVSRSVFDQLTMVSDAVQGVEEQGSVRSPAVDVSRSHPKSVPTCVPLIASSLALMFPSIPLFSPPVRACVRMCVRVCERVCRSSPGS